jgi:predicted nucleic acid-binding protein
MTAEFFLDTNVLVYAAIGTGKDERKRKRALALIESENFGTSAQVLQEFFVTVTRKAARPLSASETLEWIEQFVAFPCQPSCSLGYPAIWCCAYSRTRRSAVWPTWLP